MLPTIKLQITKLRSLRPLGWRNWGLSLSLCSSLWAGSVLPLNAVEINGTTQFVELPQLTYAAASNTDAYGRGSSFFFTITVPDGATEALKRVTIQQTQGTDRRWYNSIYRLQAFEGTRRKPERELALETVGFDPEARALLIDFAPAIAPGTTVTIRIRPRRNPGPGGIYLFQVNGFPDGVNPISQYLGLGRFHFYDRRDRYWY
ncbi:MAG: DUF2808 domain-containing protein [Cyanobacteria bacterium P01_H01_bin.121]